MPAPSFRLGYTKPLTRYKFNPTAVGNAMLSTTQKKFGTTSLYLDGTADSVQTYDTNIALGSGDYCIEFWAYYPNVSSRTNGICDFRTSGVNQIAPAIYVNTSGQIIFNMNGVVRMTSGALTAQTWIHIAINRSGNTNRIFINGSQSTSFTDQSNYTYSQFIIGSLTGGNNNPALGYYDEWRISRTARYTANFTAPTEPFENDEFTLLLLHFNDYHGSKTIEDDIGNLAPQMTRSSLLANFSGNAQISTTQSKVGSSSLYCDGTGDSIRYVSDTLTIGTGDFTIECWVYATAKNRDQNIFDQRSTTNSQVVPAVFVNTSNQLGYYVSQAYRIQSTANTIDINTWYHISVCRSGTSTRMFLNGVQVSSTYTDTNNYSNIPLSIGAYNNGSTVLGSWQGYIDEFRVSNTARYTENFTPPTEPFTNDDNTLLLLHFEGTNQTIGFFDDAGTRSSLPISQVGDAKISTTQSKFGSSSLYLDGVGDYLLFTYTDSLILRMSEWCIEMWVYAQRNNVLQVLYEGVDTSNVGGPTLQITSTGALQYFTFGSARITGTAGEITTNTWHHIALVRNINPVTTTNQHKIYLNGVQTGSTWSNNTAYERASRHRLGALYNGASPFQGYIDEVRVSRVPRYTANFTPPTTAFTNDSDTLLLLHFEAGNGSTIFEDDNT